MLVADQEVLSEFAVDSTLQAQRSRAESANQQLVFDLFDRPGWSEDLSEETNEAIWLIIQHTSDKDQGNRRKGVW